VRCVCVKVQCVRSGKCVAQGGGAWCVCAVWRGVRVRRCVCVAVWCAFSRVCGSVTAQVCAGKVVFAQRR